MRDLEEVAQVRARQMLVLHHHAVRIRVVVARDGHDLLRSLHALGDDVQLVQDLRKGA